MSLEFNHDGWINCTLGDIVNFKRGYDLPKDEMNDGEYPVVGSNGIIGFHDDFTTPSPGITIGRSGNVGTPFIINTPSWSHNTTLYIEEFKNVDPYFVYYFLKTIDLKQFAGGSAVPTLNRNHIHPIEICIPNNIQVQKKIAKILLELDAKIELNQKINHNLTTSLLLLFKNWFVDFNFFNKNNKHNEIDNAKMKNSELGLIPNNWDVDILGNYLKIERGLSYKGKYLSDEGIPLINLGNVLPNSKFRLEKLKFYSGDFDEKVIVHVGDILVANTDLTQDRLVLGSPIIVPSLIDEETIIYSHHLNCLSNFKLPKFYIFYNLLSERYNHMVSGYATGTTVLAISKEAINNYLIIIPPKELLLKFENIAENIEKIKENNLLEIKKLKKLRDTLLPKLMSGEIDVSKVNCDLD